MSEQITRKIPVEGDPNARNIKEEFGTSFNELLDGIEFKPKDDEDEVIDDLVLEEKPKEEKPKEDKPNDKPNDKPKESKEPEVEKDKVRKKEELEDLSLEIDLPSLDLDTEEVEEVKETPDPENEDNHTRADDEDSKNELEELRKDPHTHVRVKKNIDRLLGKIQNLNKQLRDKDSEIEKVKTAAPKEVAKDPVLEEEKNELIMLRRRYSIDKDQTLKEYDVRVKSAEETLMEVVKANLREDDAKQIEKMGFEAFAKLPQSFKQFLEILDDNDPAQGALVRSKYSEMVSANAEKGKKQKELLQDADKWWAEQEDLLKKHQEENSQYSEQIEKIKDDFFNATVSSDPYFKAIEVKGLKGEELARAQTDNAKRAIYQRDLKGILNANTVDDQKKVVYRAALARPLSDQVKSLQAQLKSAQDKLKKIDNARNMRPPKHDVSAPPKDDAPQDFVSQLERMYGGQ